jgi:hypothetical protein
LFADDLNLRLLVQDFLQNTPVLKDMPRLDTQDRRVLAVAAGLLELFALRSGQNPLGQRRSRFSWRVTPSE